MTPPIVVLWWGRALRLLDGEDRLASVDLREGEDAVAAILRLAAARGRAVQKCGSSTSPTRWIAMRPPARGRPGRGCAESWPATFRRWMRRTRCGAREAIRQGPKGYRTIVYVEEGPRGCRNWPGNPRRAGLAGGGRHGRWSRCRDRGGSSWLRIRAGLTSELRDLGRRALVAMRHGPSGDRSLRFFEERIAPRP